MPYSFRWMKRVGSMINFYNGQNEDFGKINMKLIRCFCIYWCQFPLKLSFCFLLKLVMIGILSSSLPFLFLKYLSIQLIPEGLVILSPSKSPLIWCLNEVYTKMYRIRCKKNHYWDSYSLTPLIEQPPMLHNWLWDNSPQFLPFFFHGTKRWFKWCLYLIFHPFLWIWQVSWMIC